MEQLKFAKLLSYRAPRLHSVFPKEGGPGAQGTTYGGYELQVKGSDLVGGRKLGLHNTIQFSSFSFDGEAGYAFAESDPAAHTYFTFRSPDNSDGKPAKQGVDLAVQVVHGDEHYPVTLQKSNVVLYSYRAPRIGRITSEESDRGGNYSKITIFGEVKFPNEGLLSYRNGGSFGEKWEERFNTIRVFPVLYALGDADSLVDASSEMRGAPVAHNERLRSSVPCKVVFWQPYPGSPRGMPPLRLPPVRGAGSDVTTCPVIRYRRNPKEDSR